MLFRVLLSTNLVQVSSYNTMVKKWIQDPNIKKNARFQEREKSAESAIQLKTCREHYFKGLIHNGSLNGSLD